MMRGALIVGLLVVIATWSIAVGAPRGAQAFGSEGIAIVRGDSDAAPQIDVAPQASDDDDDTSMRVVLWTLLAAGIAAGVGLVLYMVRVLLGRVQPPTVQQQKDAHH